MHDENDKNNSSGKKEIKADEYDKEKDAADKEQKPSTEGNTATGNETLNEQKESD